MENIHRIKSPERVGHIVESKVSLVQDVKDNGAYNIEGDSDARKSGIYTNKRLSGLALGRGGFKSIRINKRTTS
jgi:hypothetical protein